MDALLSLNAYDWLVFTSANGVTAFFDLFFGGFPICATWAAQKLPRSARPPRRNCARCTCKLTWSRPRRSPAKWRRHFARFESIENLKLCLLRAEVANPDLPRALEEMGAIVDDIAVYKTEPETEDPGGVAADLLARGADWVTFTSGSTVGHFHTRFDLPKLVKQYPQMKLASIGPETSKAIRTLGLEPAREAKKHTTEGLIAELLK